MSPDPTTGKDLVYCNGIDPDTGTYSLPPFAIDDLAKNIRSRPASPEFLRHHGKAVALSFAAAFGVDKEKPAEAGWAIVFHEDTPQDVKEALAPL